MVGPRVKGTFSHPAILIAWPDFPRPRGTEVETLSREYFWLNYHFFFFSFILNPLSELSISVECLSGGKSTNQRILRPETEVGSYWVL